MHFLWQYLHYALASPRDVQLSEELTASDEHTSRVNWDMEKAVNEGDKALISKLNIFNDFFLDFFKLLLTHSTLWDINWMVSEVGLATHTEHLS